MVQAIININEDANRVINIVKAKHGLKDKSEAINMLAKEYKYYVLEPEIRPEYLEKLEKIKKQKGLKFRDVNELRKFIKDAGIRD